MRSLIRWCALAVSGLLLSAMLILSGCSDKSQEEQQSQIQVIAFPGKTVTLLIPESQAGMFRWEIILEEWEAQTQGTTQVKPYADVETLLTLLQQEENRTETIVFFPRQEFSEIGIADVLTTIPEQLQGAEDFNWNDLFDSLRNSGLKWNGKPAVLPVREPILLLYYRPDLLEAAGLNPPRSWQDYRELLTKIGDWAPGLSAVEPWGQEFRPFMYLTHALPYAHASGNYSVFFNYSNGTPLIDTPGFARGIEDSRETLKLLDPASAEMSPEDCLNAIRNGTAAMAIAPAFPSINELSTATEDSANHIFPVAAVPVPGATTIFDPARDTWRDLYTQVNRVALSGWEGLFVGVAKTQPEESRAAWNLLRRLMISDEMTDSRNCFAPGGMTSTRLSTSLQVWSPEFERLDEKSHVDAVSETLRKTEVVPALMIAHRSEFLGELNATLNRLIFEDPAADAQAGLQDLAKSWSALLEKYGPDQTRLSYARSLGIPINR